VHEFLVRDGGDFEFELVYFGLDLGSWLLDTLFDGLQ
jgi:hypothetical protein